MRTVPTYYKKCAGSEGKKIRFGRGKGKGKRRKKIKAAGKGCKDTKAAR
jgi:hypothetical protein